MSSESKLIVPVVHLNGTSKEELVRQLCDASIALNGAYTAIQEAAPNARDYYNQGTDALSAATRQHRNWLLGLEAIKKEIDELAIAIFEQ